MMRIAFDPELPIVTAASFRAGDRDFVADEPFPWRDLGLSETDLHAFWLAGLVRCVPVEAPGDAARDIAIKGEHGQMVVFRATPGPTVRVETPAQRRERKRKAPAPPAE